MMKDTRPINMLILTVFMIVLTAFALVATSMTRPRAGMEIRSVNRNNDLQDASVNARPEAFIPPAAQRVFDLLTTLFMQMCRAASQTQAGLVRTASGRLPGLHSITMRPWVMCSALTF